MIINDLYWGIYLFKVSKYINKMRKLKLFHLPDPFSRQVRQR